MVYKYGSYVYLKIPNISGNGIEYAYIVSILLSNKNCKELKNNILSRFLNEKQFHEYMHNNIF